MEEAKKADESRRDMMKDAVGALGPILTQGSNVLSLNEDDKKAKREVEESKVAYNETLAKKIKLDMFKTVTETPGLSALVDQDALKQELNFLLFSKK